MAITTEQIWAAADKLQREGRPPASAAVREVLGQGPYSKITLAMSEWRTLQARTAKSNVSVSGALTARIRQAMEQVCADALGVVGEWVAAEREALRTARSELDAECLEMASLLDEVSNDAVAQAEAAAQCERKLEAEIDRLNGDLITASIDTFMAYVQIGAHEESLRMEREERQSLQASLAKAREELAALQVSTRRQPAVPDTTCS